MFYMLLFILALAVIGFLISILPDVIAIIGRVLLDLCFWLMDRKKPPDA